MYFQMRELDVYFFKQLFIIISLINLRTLSKDARCDWLFRCQFRWTIRNESQIASWRSEFTRTQAQCLPVEKLFFRYLIILSVIRYFIVYRLTIYFVLARTSPLFEIKYFSIDRIRCDDILSITPAYWCDFRVIKEMRLFEDWAPRLREERCKKCERCEWLNVNKYKSLANTAILIIIIKHLNNVTFSTRVSRK